MVDTLNRRERLWNRYYICVFLACIFFQTSQNILNNSISLYTVSIFGNASTSGVLAASYAVFAITARFIAGFFSDHAGRRIVAVVGCLIFALSALMLGVFPGFAALIIFRGLNGFGFSTANTSMLAVAVDTAPKSKMNQGIGFFWLAQAIAAGSGGAIALALIWGDNFMPVFIGACVSLLAACVLMWLCSYEKNPAYKPEAGEDEPELSEYKGIARYFEKRALPAGIIAFCMNFAFAVITTYLLLLAETRGYENAGFFFTLTAIAMFLGTFFSASLSKRFGYFPVLVFELVLAAIGLLLVGLVDSIALFFFCAITYGLGQGLGYTALNALAVKGVPANRRGAASGTFMIMVDLAIGLGGVTWGFLIDRSGFGPVYTAAACCMAVGLVLAAVFFRRERGRQEA